MKFEGRINRDVDGFVKLDFAAQIAVEAKERTAAAVANSFILKEAGNPA